MDGYLTVPEVAAELRFTVAAVRNWIHAGQLKAVKVSNRYRIKEEELRRFVGNGDGSKDENKEVSCLKS
jgi:excisionase family DNA binding protein